MSARRHVADDGTQITCDRAVMKQDGAAPASQRRHVSIRVSLSGSDDTAAEAGSMDPGGQKRAELIALVNKLLGHDQLMPKQHANQPRSHTAAPAKVCRRMPWVRAVHNAMRQAYTRSMPMTGSMESVKYIPE